MEAVSRDKPDIAKMDEGRCYSTLDGIGPDAELPSISKTAAASDESAHVVWPQDDAGKSYYHSPVITK